MNVVVTVPVSPDMVDNISPDPLDASHASSLCSLPSPFPECHNMSLVNYHDVLEENVDDCVESLGIFRGYDPSPDPYSLYLGNVPIKIMFTIVCNHSKDFAMAFGKFRRALTIILGFMFKCSYFHPSELQAQVFNKLLRCHTPIL